MKRRNLILLLGGASSGAMSVGTGAFSSMEAERGVEMSVVGNRDAFVGYYVPRGEPKDEQYIPEDASKNGDPVENGERIPLVEVRSEFGREQEISLVGVQIERGYDALRDGSYEVERKLPDSGGYEDVDHVEFTEGATEPDPVDAPKSGFGPGGYETITAEVNGIEPGEEVELAMTVTLKGVEGTGIAAQLFGDAREFVITGAQSPESVPTVNFKGNSGNAELEGVDSEIEVTVWYRDESAESLERVTEYLSNGQIRNKLFEGGNRQDKEIVAVSLIDAKRTYIRTSDDLNPGDSECYTGIPNSKDEFNLETLTPCE